MPTNTFEDVQSPFTKRESSAARKMRSYLCIKDIGGEVDKSRNNNRGVFWRILFLPKYLSFPCHT